MAGIADETNVAGGEPDASRFVAFLVRPRGQAMCLLWLIGALAAASLVTVLRVNLGLGTSGPPLMFYLPAIIVVTLVTGWEYGMAALVLSVLIVWYVFLPPGFTFTLLSRPQFASIALWSLTAVPLVALSHYLRVALVDAIRSAARYRRLTAVTSDIVWRTDAQGNVRLPHPSWTRVTGMVWPDYRDRGWLVAVHEEDRPRLRPRAADGDHIAEFRLKDVDFGDWRWYRSRAVALSGPGGDIEEWITALRDVHEEKLAHENSELMIGEARHRLKNLVTIIDALAKYSKLRNAEPNAELDGFLKRFLGRLHALGAAADLVLAGQHQYVEVGALIRATLAPFLEENAQRFVLDGPAVTLSEATGGSLALAMHELATNALKYGALSAPDGRVTIRWTGVDLPEGEHVTIEWEEHGGPEARAPEREGFGSRVIKSVPARERNGDVKFEYRPQGFYCRMEFTKNNKKD